MLWRLFLVFSRVALFTWGGGPASLALMQRETTAAGWVSAAEFADAVALGNALPGPISPQVSAYIGYKMAGAWGAVAAVTGTVLPATLLMLGMVVYFFGVKDSPSIQAMLRAIRPVVIGLLLWTAYDMARVVFGVERVGWRASLAAGWDKLLFVAASLALLTFTRVNPALVILGAGLLGLVLHR
jgi:chromate transporter